MVLVRWAARSIPDVGYVHTIRLADQVTHVPLAPEWVAGVVNLRRILSVIDLSVSWPAGCG
jgi:chemotaxis signal transduction protein